MLYIGLSLSLDILGLGRGVASASLRTESKTVLAKMLLLSLHMGEVDILHHSAMHHLLNYLVHTTL
jgi:hypothetical protein